jgi:hypothetical protein
MYDLGTTTLLGMVAAIIQVFQYLAKYRQGAPGNTLQGESSNADIAIPSFIKITGQWRAMHSLLRNVIVK